MPSAFITGIGDVFCKSMVICRSFKAGVTDSITSQNVVYMLEFCRFSFSELLKADNSLRSDFREGMKKSL